MKTDRKNPKRLPLSRTTLRRLGAGDLTRIAGGETTRHLAGGDIIIFDIVD